MMTSLLAATLAVGACGANATPVELTACVNAAPMDRTLRVRLLRTLAEERRFDAALLVAKAALASSPDDLEFGRWRVRLLAWSGDHRAAQVAEETLPTRTGIGAARLRADLAFWRGDHEAAVEASKEVLELQPHDAQAQRQLGVMAAGKATEMGRNGQVQAGLDYLAPYTARWPGELNMGRVEARLLFWSGEHEQAERRILALRVAAPDDPELVALSAQVAEARKGPLRHQISLQPSWTYVDAGSINAGSSWWDLTGTYAMRVTPKYTAGTGVEVRHRDLHDLATTDVLLSAFGGARLSDRWAVEAGGAYTVDPKRAPDYQLWLEPGYQVAPWLRLSLKYWYMRFAPSDVHVFVPAAWWTKGEWFGDLRYFLSVDDAYEAHHVVLGHVGRQLGAGFALTLGAGVGDRTDYLVANEVGENDSHLLLSAGLGYAMTATQTLGLDYIYTDETLSGVDADGVGIEESFKRHQFLLGWRYRW